MEKQDIYESLIGLLFPSDITEHFKIVHLSICQFSKINR